MLMALLRSLMGLFATVAEDHEEEPKEVEMATSPKNPVLRRGSSGNSVRELQSLLNEAGASLSVDGFFGPATEPAVRNFQSSMGLSVDGIVGRQTWATLRGAKTADPIPPTPPVRPLPTAPRFEAITRSRAAAVFGPAGSSRATAGQCVLPFYHVLAWAPSQRINRFRCHELLSEAMTWVYSEAAKHYGEAEYRRLRLDQWGGCFNNRMVRGSSRTISIHAYGAAVDTDPARNGLHTPTAQATLSRPEYEPWWKIVEATGGRSLGKRIGRDWMHWSYVQE